MLCLVYKNITYAIAQILHVVQYDKPRHVERSRNICGQAILNKSSMKKLFFTSILFFSVLLLSAQSDTLRTKGRKSIPTVIGKWQLDSISSGPKNNNTGSRTIEFNENGEYKETIADQSQTGMWKIENGTIIRDGRTTTIENLTMKKMVISGLDGKKKVFYYYSRMDYKAPKQDVIPH